VRRRGPLWLGALLAGASLLLAGCQAQAPKTKGRSVLMSEPERPLTLCERPARPALQVENEAINSSFAAFSRGWMDKLRREGVPQPGHQLFVSDATETELRPTGHAIAPYVGILRHCEMTLLCDDAKQCRMVGRTVVTEIFRFQGGEWVY
jgi:hypothetical protein